MKTIITTLLLCSLAITSSISQNIEGIATYKTDRQIDLQMDEEDGMSDDIQKSIQAQLKAQFQKEFTLSFNNNESFYKEVPKLNAPQAAPKSGIQIKISGNSDVLYRNISENTYKSETEIMSKEFLIQDTLKKPNWVLAKDTKNIGDYLCFKATLTDTIQKSKFDDKTMEYEETEEERVTTAWYTLQIPVPHGPSNFWGLPGLVLEINDGDQTILCSKIVLNPKKGVNIEVPKKGKKVTQAKFDEIQEKKTAEMMEQFQQGTNKKKRNGATHVIRIGGS